MLNRFYQREPLPRHFGLGYLALSSKPAIAPTFHLDSGRSKPSTPLVDSSHGFQGAKL